MEYKTFFYILLTAYLSMLCTNSLAQDGLGFIKVRITVNEDQSLAKLFTKFVKTNSVIRKSSVMTKKTFKANPTIKNWRLIKKGTKVNLYIDKAFLDPIKFENYKKSVQKRRLKGMGTKKQKKKHFSVTSSSGMVVISDEENNLLEMSFFKFAVNYSNVFRKNYIYQVGISSVGFFNLKYSSASETVRHDGLLPEFNFGISRSLSERFSFGIDYDYLNYFLLRDASDTTFNLSPEEIHRVNAKPSFKLNSNFELISSAGFLSGVGSGFDCSFGVVLNYSRDGELQGKFTLLGYYSQLEIEERNESSNAVVFSFKFMI